MYKRFKRESMRGNAFYYRYRSCDHQTIYSGRNESIINHYNDEDNAERMIKRSQNREGKQLPYSQSKK